MKAIFSSVKQAIIKLFKPKWQSLEISNALPAFLRELLKCTN